MLKLLVFTLFFFKGLFTRVLSLHGSITAIITISTRVLIQILTADLITDLQRFMLLIKFTQEHLGNSASEG